MLRLQSVLHRLFRIATLIRFQHHLKFQNQISEIEWIHILGQQIQQEPVAHIARGTHLSQRFLRCKPAVRVCGHDSNPREEDGGESEQQRHCTCKCEQVAPKPQEEVQFFVEYVHRQDAQCVVSLDIARLAVQVECALGQTGEHAKHRVVPDGTVPAGEGEHLTAVREEFAAQKVVDEGHLTANVDKVDDLLEFEIEIYFLVNIFLR